MFTLIVFRHFVCLHHRHCPRITNLVLTQFFSGAEPKQAIPSGWYGPILPVSNRIAHERYKRYNNTNHYARISVGSYLQSGKDMWTNEHKKKLMPCRLFGFACVLNVWITNIVYWWLKKQTCKQKNYPTVGGRCGDHRHTRVHTPA